MPLPYTYLILFRILLTFWHQSCQIKTATEIRKKRITSSSLGQPKAAQEFTFSLPIAGLCTFTTWSQAIRSSLCECFCHVPESPLLLLHRLEFNILCISIKQLWTHTHTHTQTYYMFMQLTASQSWFQAFFVASRAQQKFSLVFFPWLFLLQYGKS